MSGKVTVLTQKLGTCLLRQAALNHIESLNYENLYFTVR